MLKNTFWNWFRLHWYIHVYTSESLNTFWNWFIIYLWMFTNTFWKLWVCTCMYLNKDILKLIYMYIPLNFNEHILKIRYSKYPWINSKLCSLIKKLLVNPHCFSPPSIDRVISLKNISITEYPLILYWSR